MAEKIRCPQCGSALCAEIRYGRIAETDQLRQEIRAGKVVLGGCLVFGEMPEWRCLDCGAEWKDAKDELQSK